MRDAETSNGQPPARPGVDLRVWTPERAVLTDIGDILHALHASIEGQRTGKAPPSPRRMPRPVVARDLVDQADALARHHERVRLLLPHKRRRE